MMIGAGGGGGRCEFFKFGCLGSPAPAPFFPPTTQTPPLILGSILAGRNR